VLPKQRRQLGEHQRRFVERVAPSDDAFGDEATIAAPS
jgi:hypothetical protein